MFVGHYAVAPLAASTGKVTLWQAFIAVQLLDFAWVPFVFMGLEKIRIEPGFTQGSALDLHFIPYTHSLLLATIWAGLGAAVFMLLQKDRRLKRVKIGAVLIALLVLSHWVLDVIVHVPDLTLWPGSVRLGLGLWNQVFLSFGLEIALTLLAFLYYFRCTENISPHGLLWPVAFVGLLIGLQVVSNFGPPPASVTELLITALLAFIVLAILAGRLERTRRLRS